MPYHVAKGAQKNYNFYLKEVEVEYKKSKPTSIFWEDVVANAILFKTADKLFGRKGVDAIGDTNTRSQTVAFALSLLHHMTNKKIDLGTIWKNQRVEESLQREIKKGLVYVNKFFGSFSGQLISELAKSEKTWRTLLEKDENPFDNDVLDDFCLSAAAFKKRYEQKEDDLEEKKKYNDLQSILNLGLRFWDGLNLYMLKTNVLTTTQQIAANSIRGKIKRSGEFTVHEISKGVEIIESLNNEGANLEEISKLSKLSETALIDPSAIYDRFSKLDKLDWDKIIQLGDQTGTLNFNEISVIRTVIQKIKRKETIDLKRLQITEEALKKLKKYGLKY
jgi:hypothetical protein